MKRLARSLLALIVLLLVYLAVVAWWASASVDTLLARYPADPAAALLSQSQRAILLRIEDPTFYSHHGLSLADGQGVATISSAVAREMFLDGATLDGARGLLQGVYRGVFACCKRIDFGRDLMALVLDAKVSKERQLAIYTSSVYMGRQDGKQMRGLQGAAQAYLGKPLASLGDDEMAALVAMIRAPNELHPLRNRDAYELRLLRVRAVLAGRCKPSGWFDTTYAHCKN